MAGKLTMAQCRRYSIPLAVFLAFSAVSPLGEPHAWATHGPPHDCQGQAITSNSLQATNGDDNLYGSIVRDVIALGYGADQSVVGAGDDYLCGNQDGDPNLDGGGGVDVINGGDGIDNIFGQSGNDTIYAGSGADSAVGDADNDYVEGNLGQDDVGGYDGNDTVKGNEDPDEVFDGRGSDIVQGNAPSTGSPGDILYRCDTNNTVSGFELKLGPSDVYC